MTSFARQSDLATPGEHERCHAEPRSRAEKADRLARNSLPRRPNGRKFEGTEPRQGEGQCGKVVHETRRLDARHPGERSCRHVPGTVRHGDARFAAPSLDRPGGAGGDPGKWRTPRLREKAVECRFQSGIVRRQINGGRCHLDPAFPLARKREAGIGAADIRYEKRAIRPAHICPYPSTGVSGRATAAKAERNSSRQFATSSLRRPAISASKRSRRSCRLI